MCTAPGCCRPNRWRCVKAVLGRNSRESRSHAAQSFRASTQPFDFRTSMNRARNVSPTQQYPSSFHPSKYLCPSALTAEDTESYRLRKTWSPIKLTRGSHSGLWIALSERASILLPAHPKPFVYIKSPVFCPLVWSTYQYIAIHHYSLTHSLTHSLCLPPNSILHPSTRLNIYAHLLLLQRTQNPIVTEKPGVR